MPLSTALASLLSACPLLRAALSAAAAAADDYPQHLQAYYAFLQLNRMASASEYVGGCLQLHLHGTPPRPALLAAGDFPRHLLVFGGAGVGRCNDVLLLDLVSWQWSRPLLTGTAPSPRQGAALAVAGALSVSLSLLRCGVG